MRYLVRASDSTSSSELRIVDTLEMAQGFKDHVFAHWASVEIYLLVPVEEKPGPSPEAMDIMKSV
jgi:hypothetical protein